MKQHPLEKLLQQDAPPPDPAARLAARRAALAEFERLNPAPQVETSSNHQGFFQALLGALRLSRDPDNHGRDSMPRFSNKVLYGGAASICLAIIGSTVVWNTLKQNPAVGELEVAAAARDAQPVDASEQAGVRTQPQTGADAPVASDDKLRSEAEQQLAARVAADERKAEELLRQAKAVSQPETVEALPPPVEQYVMVGPAAAATQDALAKEKDGDEQMQEVIVTGEKRVFQPSVQTSPMTVVAAEAINSAPPPHKGVAAPRVKQTADSRNRAEGYSGLLSLNEPPVAPPPPQAEGNDKFEHFDLNPVRQPSLEAERVSTFSADVDTSSYSFVRKQLDQGVLPQKDAVRAEEMINYFDYAWPAAESREKPFRPTIVVSDSPWGKGRKLIHIGIKGYELPASKRPDANIVMLLDVSGSMNSPDKLPLVQESMKLLVGSLKTTDTVSIVVYAGAAGLVLPPTQVGEKEKILAALDRLTPGGSTAGAAGIELAYQLAEKSFRKEGLNRILLCTDGDFNVGIAGTEELKGLVERKRATGIFLSVLGYGQGNYRDELAQALAQNGNGVAAYIDTLNEAQKVLVQQAGSSLFNIARDVKFQVEFNPATVAEYRLVGYETRALKREDFNNDKVDAGDVGSGHTVTAIYEITPVGAARMMGESRYVKPPVISGKANEYGFLKMRYKLPGKDSSELIEQPINVESGKASEAIQRDVEFSTAVAGFAQLLRGGQYTGSLKYEDVIKQALAARGEDQFGYRSEFVQLVRKAQAVR